MNASRVRWLPVRIETAAFGPARPEAFSTSNAHSSLFQVAVVSFGRPTSALVISEPQSLIAELFAQDAILFAQVFDRHNWRSLVHLASAIGRKRKGERTVGK